jgi:hypothetical protein
MLATNYGQSVGGGGASVASPAAAMRANAMFSTVAIATPAVALRSLWGELQTLIDPSDPGDGLRI